jgi:hypothetical protein
MIIGTGQNKLLEKNASGYFLHHSGDAIPQPIDFFVVFFLSLFSHHEFKAGAKLDGVAGDR